MASTYPKACMLSTFHFSQQKFTEDVLRHVSNTQIFIKMLGRSLLISHLMLLMILPSLLVGPSGKEWQTPPHIWYLTKEKIQQECDCNSTVPGWCCPVPAMTALFPLHICVSLKPMEPSLNTSVPLHAEHYVGEKQPFSNHVPVDQNLLPAFRNGVAGGAVRIKNWGHWEDKSGSEESENYRWSTDKTQDQVICSLDTFNFPITR